jgi:hypothetical protein
MIALSNFRIRLYLVVLCGLIAHSSFLCAQVSGAMPKGESSATLSGTVAGRDGTLARQEISIYRLGAERGHPVLLQSCVSNTDSDGNFRCDHLLPGEYLAAVKLGAGPALTDAEKLPAFSLYGGSGDMDRIIPVVLQPNDSQSLVFVPSTEGVYRIQGRIPEQLKNVQVSLSAVATSGLEYPVPVQVISDSEGKFLFDRIPAGQYIIRADWKDKQKNERSAVYYIAVADRDITGIVLETSGTNVKVSLGDSTDNFAEAVAPIVDLENVNTGLETKGLYDGTKREFSFDRIPPGDYLLSVKEPVTACIDAVSVAGRESSNPFHVDGQQLYLNIDADVRPRCGSIQGVLAPATGGQLILISERMEVVRTAESDPSGNFVISGVTSGRYELLAWPSTKYVAYRNGELLRSLSDHSVSVQVPENGTTSSIVVPQQR